MGVRPLHLVVGARRIFCLHDAPAGPVRGAVVYVPPLAEEMNKSRRMVALQARALSAKGWHVLRIDLAGTGDSEGDFEAARWSDWLADVAAARSWLATEAGVEPWLWGLRLGALLAAVSAEARIAPGLLLWQPVGSGRQHLQQFLRFKAGSEWLNAAEASAAESRPLAQLQAGQVVEVAGYRLHPGLALPMAEAELVLPTGLAAVGWFELSPRGESALSVLARRSLERLPSAARVQAQGVAGPGFWRSVEIEVAPALIETSLACLESS